MVQETEAEQIRLEQLEAAASALSSVPPAPAYPPVPAMPTAAQAEPALLAPRAAATDESDIADALAFRRSGRSRLWIYGGIGALVVLAGIGGVLALSGGGVTERPGRPNGPRTPAPPVHPLPPPVAMPPTPVPPPVLPPVAVDGGPVAVADAGVPTAIDGGAVAAADGGAAAAPPTPPPPPAPIVAPGPPDDDPRSTADLIKYARASVRRRRWLEARRAFETVLRREPTNLDGLLGAALVAMSERRHDDAVRFFQGAVQQRPDSATFQVYLGNAHLSNGNREAAEGAWRRALEIDPRQREARQRLGLGGRAPRRPTKAPGKASPAIRRNPYR